MHQIPRFSEGKTTYWVRYQRFFNDSYTRDGKQRAVEYCEQNGIPTDEIITFDSQLEADRYEYLLEQVKCGKIRNLKHHEKIPLIEEFINANGEIIEEQSFNADFVYFEGNTVVVEDVKGASLFTDTRFELAKKIFDYKYKDKNCYCRIIIKRQKEWVEWHLGEHKKPRTLIQQQKAKIAEQKKALHEQEIANNKLEREKERFVELTNLYKDNKITRAQLKRMKELEIILKDKGLLI